MLDNDLLIRCGLEDLWLVSETILVYLSCWPVALCPLARRNIVVIIKAAASLF